MQTFNPEHGAPKYPFFGLKRAIRLGFLLAIVTAALSMLQPNYYRSEAKILPMDGKSAGGGLGQLAAAAAAFGVGVPGQDGGDANFVDILRSRSPQEGLLKTEFQFQARSWRFGALSPRRQTLYDYLHAKNMDRATATLDRMISVSRDPKSKVITISAETKEPELSQQLVTKSVKALETFILEKGRTRGGAKASFASARLKESKEEVALAEEAFRRFLEGNRNYQISTDPSVRLLGARLEAELKLKQQLILTLAVNREQSLLEEKNDVPMVNVLDPANLPLEKSRPARSTSVLLAMILGTFSSLLWLNRTWVRSILVRALA